MDSFEWNKIFGALLGCAFVMLSLSFVAESLFSVHPPHKEGYALEGGGDVAHGTATPKAKAEIESANEMMASMELARGAKIAKKCAACHTFDSGGKSKVGPALYDIVNRPMASVGDFGYSKAMNGFAAGKIWDYDLLNKFIFKPKDLIKGTSMGFAGLKKLEDRAALLLYLRSLSPNPAPLP